MRSLCARTFILVLLALCAARAASGRQAAPKLDWQEFKSVAGGFSVKFPVAPRVSQVPIVRGPVTLTRHVHAAAAGEYEFEVDYMDMPAGYNDPALALEGGIIGFTRFAQSKGGRVLTNGKAVRGTCEGREATASVSSAAGKTGFAQARAFYSGQRYYFAIFNARADNEAARAVGRAFMDSLEIKDGCKAPLTPTAAPVAAPVHSTVEGTHDPATGWRKLDMLDLGFSVLMPGPARRKYEQTQVQPFPVFHNEFLYEGENVVYTAETLGDYPAGFYSTETSLENLLDLSLVVIKRNLAELGLAYGEPRKLRVGTYPGREYAVANEKAGTRGRIQTYATPRRAYIFIAFSFGGAPRDKDIERFFSSVRVSPK
jgi:hypothetical protein